MRIAERAARLDLTERRRQIDERARQRAEAIAQRRQRQRATRRAQRRKRRRQTITTAVSVLRRALVHLGVNVIAVPIVAATASAWWFQYNAMRAAGLAVLLACTVATSLESLGLAFAGLAHKARAVQDSAAPYRIGMWAIVFMAAAVNYRHGSSAWSQPGLTGVVFASLSVGSVAGWELRERQAYRQRIATRLPARRPQFGPAHWLRFPLRTWRALSTAIRDGITDPVTALSIADADRRQRRFVQDTRRAFDRKALDRITQRLANAEHPHDIHAQPATTLHQYPVPQAHGRLQVADDEQGRCFRPQHRHRGSSRPTRRTTPTPNPAGDNSNHQHSAPAKPDQTRNRRRQAHTAAAPPNNTAVDISDLLPLAQQIAVKLGPQLSRDRPLDRIRQHGHSIGGRRRDAIYNAVRPPHQVRP
ncbi:DUF2637 domain-containing protein [Amycolatopsis cihanbeyliensis]